MGHLQNHSKSSFKMIWWEDLTSQFRVPFMAQYFNLSNLKIRTRCQSLGINSNSMLCVYFARAHFACQLIKSCRLKHFKMDTCKGLIDLLFWFVSSLITLKWPQLLQQTIYLTVQTLPRELNSTALIDIKMGHRIAIDAIPCSNEWTACCATDSSSTYSDFRFLGHLCC